MNILFTCAGRRNYLINFFREAMGGNGQLLAVDSTPDAPALQEVDKAFVVPQITSDNYLQKILEICQQNKVRLLFSLNDLELPLLARHRSLFLEIETIPVVSSEEVVNTCFDKWKTVAFLELCNLNNPKTYPSLPKALAALDERDVVFPLVVKPRWGTASIGIHYPRDREELELTYRLLSKHLKHSFLKDISAFDPERCIIIQERLEGEEYHLDVINDLNGNYVCTFVKHKLAMRAGETDKAVTVNRQQLDELGRIIGQKLGHIGNLDCDVFVSEKGCYVLEMNPRFGGGYPFAHVAGANVPAALMAWASGKIPEASWLRVKPNVKAAKYDHIVVVKDLKTS